MENKTYLIYTMGCKLNENDSEKIAGIVEKLGYSETENIEEANLVVFNTCCIRENAEEKLFGKIGQIKNFKLKNNAIIAVGGCMMQEKHMLEKIKKSYPYVDIIFGTHTLHKLEENLRQVIENNRKTVDVIDIFGEIHENLPIKRNDDTKASITIMYGCDNFCTYCIVPYVRGRERSRKKEDILNEIKKLAQNGYTEVILLGQNVNSYNDNGAKFDTLLRDVNTIKGIERIRFVSPHPKDFTDEVISAIRDCKNVCKLIHLPIQSGSTNILEKMNRKYTKEQYLKLVEKIKKEIPEIALSTDIIVGFPGETEDDFNETLDVIKKVDFEQVYMFIYSKRVGTVAETMENHITEKIKHERFERLKKLVDSGIQEKNKKYMNTIQKVLVEGISKNNDDMLTGRTESNVIVVFSGDKNLIGNTVQLKIIAVHKWHLKGELLCLN